MVNKKQETLLLLSQYDTCFNKLIESNKRDEVWVSKSKNDNAAKILIATCSLLLHHHLYFMVKFKGNKLSRVDPIL